MKKKLHYFDLKQQKLRKYLELDQNEIESYLLSKYFPKYQKEFFLTNQNGAVKSKVKRTKIIKSFQSSETLQKRSDWRVLLASKMKSVRTLHNTYQSTKQFAEKLRFFSGLKSVQILMFPSPFRSPEKHREVFLHRAFRNIGCVQNLEHLEVTPVSIESKKFFPRLNSYQRLLDSLKTLKFYFDWTDASEVEISELIDKNKNLLKNVTSLELSSLHSSFHFESFQRLGNLCPKISNLCFELRDPDISSDEPFEVKPNYLQTLGAFQNMRYLQLYIADTLTFLKDFILPSSIQSLALTFQECLTIEIMRKIDDNFVESSEEKLSKTFEENNLLLRFYEAFRDLKDLETLHLFFGLESNAKAYKFQSYLFRSLLKRISSPLKNLRVLPTAFSRMGRGVFIPDKQDPYLPQFIESCENFASTLESLELGSSNIIYSKFDLSAYRNKFTKLSEIIITANFLQDSDIETPDSLLKHLISLGASIRRIKLGAYVNRRAESLLSILKQMKQLGKPNQLKVGIELHLMAQKGIEGPGMSFAEGIDELRSNEEDSPRAEGVFLKLFEGYVFSNEMKTFFKLYKERFYPFE